jgi:hypothetical protein
VTPFHGWLLSLSPSQRREFTSPCSHPMEAYSGSSCLLLNHFFIERKAKTYAETDCRAISTDVVDKERSRLHWAIAPICRCSRSRRPRKFFAVKGGDLHHDSREWVPVLTNHRPLLLLPVPRFKLY